MNILLNNNKKVEKSFAVFNFHLIHRDLQTFQCKHPMILTISYPVCVFLLLDFYSGCDVVFNVDLEKNANASTRNLFGVG